MVLVPDFGRIRNRGLHYLLPMQSTLHSLTTLSARRLTYLTALRSGDHVSTYVFDGPQLTPVDGSQGELDVSVNHSEAAKPMCWS